MTIEFGPAITGNRRGEVQLFIENEVDRDTDIYFVTVSRVPGNYAYMRAWWHRSDADHEEHLTGDVFVGNAHVGTAHVYLNGQVTMFSAGED